MRWVGVIVLSALAFDLPMTDSIVGQAVSATIDTQRNSTTRADRSPLIADCTETVTPSPLSRRPVLRRATYAAKPSKPRRHRARVRHKVHHARHMKHKAIHHRHRPLRHPRAHRRPAVHRATYASPLCGQRSEIINDMLGLSGVAQPPVAAEITADTYLLPTFIDVPPPIGPGPIGPGPIIFPGGPIYPVGPGPIIVSPPGPPVTPPVTPPISSPAPEPASWATIVAGMMLVGHGMRRRAAGKAAQ